MKDDLSPLECGIEVEDCHKTNHKPESEKSRQKDTKKKRDMQNRRVPTKRGVEYHSCLYRDIPVASGTECGSR